MSVKIDENILTPGHLVYFLIAYKYIIITLFLAFFFKYSIVLHVHVCAYEIHFIKFAVFFFKHIHFDSHRSLLPFSLIVDLRM